KPNTRQCVVAMWEAADLWEAIRGEWRDIPCTVCLQFVRRRDGLHAVAYMRSNGAWMGLPYDVFCFTSVLAIVASKLGIPTATYTHCVGSMHLYEQHAEKYAKKTLVQRARTRWPAHGYSRVGPPEGTAVLAERRIRRGDF